MNDQDIAKLAAKLTISLATKEDIQQLKGEFKELKTEIKTDVKRLEEKIDTVLEFAEAVDETITSLDQRARRIEVIPIGSRLKAI